MSSSKPYHDAIQRLKEKYIGKEVSYKGRKYIVVDVPNGLTLCVRYPASTTADSRIKEIYIGDLD